MSIFSFIFEDAGTLYISLDDIERVDGKTILIHPVWFTGYENTTFSEELTWSDEQHLWSGSDPEHSWIDVLNDDSVEIHVHDLEDIINYEDMFFHCVGDLADYLAHEKGGYQTLSVIGNNHQQEEHNHNNEEHDENHNTNN